ncbi:ankyrin repeat domain-containing protein [Parashewanella spongiae]|uniref:Ankyrin repeat domain-containing protein n=1 Tax=Parashewanella spongiae TaxID=342950 RepID=A0A3A6U2V9_9GAMM|nr:ankyrin repeat domain-containing protein [Parashewanella spongiae]MCL1079526.1 ankyrin repeat domain-containing protein [Parashewanella spongiae]RJY07404.1 ankyrin repeat domain-containing protein [Parashewanella spongiae]
MAATIPSNPLGVPNNAHGSDYSVISSSSSDGLEISEIPFTARILSAKEKERHKYFHEVSRGSHKEYLPKLKLPTYAVQVDIPISPSNESGFYSSSPNSPLSGEVSLQYQESTATILASTVRPSGLASLSIGATLEREDSLSFPRQGYETASEVSESENYVDMQMADKGFYTALVKELDIEKAARILSEGNLTLSKKAVSKYIFNKYPEDFLYSAVKTKNSQLVWAILTIDKKNGYPFREYLNIKIGNCTPLLLACQNKDPETAKLIVKAGADLNITGTEVNLSAIEYCSLNNEIELVAGLLSYGAALSPAYLTSTVMIDEAIRQNVPDAIYLFVKAGVPYPVKIGGLPIFEYAMIHDPFLVEELARKGEKCTNDEKGMQVIRKAYEENNLRLMTALIISGVPYKQLFEDKTPLEYACASGCDKLVAAMHDKGELISHINPEGQSYVRIAIENCHLDVLKLLVERCGVTENTNYGLFAQDPSGDTALHVGLEVGDEKMVSYLINLAPHLACQLRNGNGQTPMQILEQKNHDFHVLFATIKTLTSLFLSKEAAILSNYLIGQNFVAKPTEELDFMIESLRQESNTKKVDLKQPKSDCRAKAQQQVLQSSKPTPLSTHLGSLV